MCIPAAIIWLLSFVRCGGICCDAVTPSLPLPVVGVSSLDLGRWRRWWPFFFMKTCCPLPPPRPTEGQPRHESSSLFRGRPIGMQLLQGDFVEPVGDRLQVLRNSHE